LPEGGKREPEESVILYGGERRGLGFYALEEKAGKDPGHAGLPVPEGGGRRGGRKVRLFSVLEKKET